MKNIDFSKIVLPTGGLPDATIFAENQLRSSVTYDPYGMTIRGDTLLFHVDLLKNVYRQEFTDRTWRKPFSKNPNFPNGTTHVLAYTMHIPEHYTEHPSKIIIAQGHTAGEGKSPVWTLGTWSNDDTVQRMDPYTEAREDEFVEQGELVLSTFCYGIVSSTGRLIANRRPTGYKLKPGSSPKVLITRYAASFEQGGYISIHIDGELLVYQKCDMVYPDELLCDNWKIGIYYADIKTANQQTVKEITTKLVSEGFTSFSYGISDFKEWCSATDTEAELVVLLMRYFQSQGIRDKYNAIVRIINS